MQTSVRSEMKLRCLGFLCVAGFMLATVGFGLAQESAKELIVKPRFADFVGAEAWQAAIRRNTTPGRTHHRARREANPASENHCEI